MLRGRGWKTAGVASAGNPDITVTGVMRAIAGTFPAELGIEIVSVTGQRAEGRLVCEERHLHPGGYVHGGVWVAFADTVAAWGTLRNLAPGDNFTTVEMKVNVFAAARTGDELLAEAEPLHLGSRTQVWEVRVRLAARPERLAANFICTQMVLPGASGSA